MIIGCTISYLFFLLTNLWSHLVLKYGKSSNPSGFWPSRSFHFQSFKSCLICNSCSLVHKSIFSLISLLILSINMLNTTLPSLSSPTFLFSVSYISPLPSAYTYRNVDNNECDPLFWLSYIIQHKYSISMVFVYPLPLNQSFLFNMYPFTAE